MKYKVEKVDGSFVVVNEKGEVSSEKFADRPKALQFAADLMNAQKVAPPERAFPNKAVGMFLGNDGCWMVCTIPFDPASKEVGSDWRVERAGTNRIEGEDKFKTTAAKEVLRP